MQQVRVRQMNHERLSCLTVPAWSSMSQGWDVYQPLCLSCKSVSWPLAEDHVCGCKRPERACGSVCYCKSSMCDCPLFERVYIVPWFTLIDAALCLHSRIHPVLSSACALLYVHVCVQHVWVCVRNPQCQQERLCVTNTISRESLYQDQSFHH